MGKNTQGAHRVAYQLAYLNEDILGEVIRHTCDNPRCVNPKHLRSGTPNDNVQDMVSKARHARGKRIHARKGEKNQCAKLTRKDVYEIRKLSTKGTRNSEIAKRFNITPSYVCQIVRGKTWKHIL